MKSDRHHRFMGNNMEIQGNRLTRRPCKGDESEYLSKNDIHFDWQACDSSVKNCFSAAR